MVYGIHWTDMQGLERSAFTDDDSTAVVVMQALRADHRLYTIGPCIENMGTEEHDGTADAIPEGRTPEVQGQIETIREGQDQIR
jgi:hypothetical protein